MSRNSEISAPSSDLGNFQDHWGPGWYANNFRGSVVCYGINKDKKPADNGNYATWYETRQAAEAVETRPKISTQGGRRKRNYSRRRRGSQKSKSRRCRRGKK